MNKKIYTMTTLGDARSSRITFIFRRNNKFTASTELRCQHRGWYIYTHTALDSKTLDCFQGRMLTIEEYENLYRWKRLPEMARKVLTLKEWRRIFKLLCKGVV